MAQAVQPLRRPDLVVFGRDLHGRDVQGQGQADVRQGRDAERDRQAGGMRPGLAAAHINRRSYRDQLWGDAASSGASAAASRFIVSAIQR